jgi:hypothetical protein
MNEDLEPGVRFLIDKLGFDGDPDKPVSDATLLKLAIRAAEQEAAAKSAKGAGAKVPGFDLGAEQGAKGASSGIDWGGRSGGDWGTRFSPFGGSASKLGGNFSDFLVKLFASGDDTESGAAADVTFDDLGASLKSKPRAEPAKKTETPFDF